MNKIKKVLKNCRNFSRDVAKWKILFLLILPLLGCETFKMPTDFGMPSWESYLYLKVAEKSFDVAKELSDVDSAFVTENGKVTFSKSFGKKNIKFTSPNIEQSSSSSQEVGFLALTDLGVCSFVIAGGISLSNAASIDLSDYSITVSSDNLGFEKAELADAVISVHCKNSSGDIVSDIDYSSLVLSANDWDDNKVLDTFDVSGKIKISKLDPTQWITLKSSGISLKGLLKTNSTLPVNFSTIIMQILPNTPTNTKVLVSKVNLASGSTSFSGDTISDTSKVSLGGDYEIYQALIGSGKIAFSKKFNLSGVKLTGINVKCPSLTKSGDSLNTTVFTEESDSVIDLTGYTLGDGSELDSLQFFYEVGYAPIPGQTISLKNTDVVEIGVRLQTDFTWVEAVVENASAFKLDSSSEVVDLGDDLPKFKNEKGTDTTFSFAKNTKLSLNASFPAVCSSGAAELIEYDLKLYAYDNGNIVESKDTTKRMSVGTVKGAINTVTIEELEGFVNSYPDSIVVKVFPKLIPSDKKFKFFCGDSIQTNTKLTSDIVFANTSQVVYYEIEDKPEEQDCIMTEKQAKAAMEINAYIVYKNNTNLSVGAELLLSKDSTYLKENLYTGISNNAKFRKIDLKVLEYNTQDTSEFFTDTISMSTEDLLMLAGDDKDKCYTFMKAKVKGSGLDLQGKLDVKVYVDVKIKMNEDLMEDDDDK